MNASVVINESLLYQRCVHHTQLAPPVASSCRVKKKGRDRSNNDSQENLFRLQRRFRMCSNALVRPRTRLIGFIEVFSQSDREPLEVSKTPQTPHYSSFHQLLIPTEKRPLSSAEIIRRMMEYSLFCSTRVGVFTARLQTRRSSRRRLHPTLDGFSGIFLTVHNW